MKKLAVMLAASAAMFAAGVAPAAAQDGPRVFTRTGSWVLDAAEDSCRLARAFTNGEDQVSLALERNRADNVVRLVLVSNAIRTFRGANTIGYRFLPDGDQRQARYIRSQTPDGQTYVNLGAVYIGMHTFAAMGVGGRDVRSLEGMAETPLYDRAAEQAYAAGITAIEFNEGFGGTIRLETGSLRGAVEALQTCTDDLLSTWGLDWQKHQTMSRRVAPVGDTFAWLPSGIVSFPEFASLNGGQNPFRVMVNAEGQPTSCTAHWVSLDADKNQRICDGIMQNGQFTPALDAAGQPIASYWMVDFMAAFSPIRLVPR
jgi:hypothetical protein